MGRISIKTIEMKLFLMDLFFLSCDNSGADCAAVVIYFCLFHNAVLMPPEQI